MSASSTFGGVRSRVRALFGGSQGEKLRQLVAGKGWYPLSILTALNVVDEFDRAAVSVFAPNLRRYFDLSNSALGAVVGAQAFLLILASVPIGYVATRVDRARLLRWSATVWAAFSAATSLAVKLPAFIAVRFGTGIGKASVEPVGRSLLADIYPRRGWNRVFAIHNAASPAGQVLGPLLAGAIGLAVVGDGAWRWAFALLTIPTVIVLLASRRLREPTREKPAQAASLSLPTSTHLSFRQAAKRLMLIPTFYRQLVGIGILGFAIVGSQPFLSVLYEEQFGIGEGGRGLILGVLATGSFVGTLVGGQVGERVFQRSPSWSVYLVGFSIAVYSFIVSGAVFLPRVELVVGLQWIAVASVFVATAPLNAILSAISPPRLRALAFSLLGLYIGLFGGLLGAVIVGAIADATDIRWGLASLAPFGVVGGLFMARGGATIDEDMDAVAREEEIEEQEAERRAQGGQQLALSVRGLDFYYGELQVLFDVELEVPEGETIALLGTNGAGKSTLLRAVAGIDLPRWGQIRLFGEDVTWVDAEDRVERGLVLIPGGRGAFPSLSVLENLRLGAYLYRRDRQRVESGVETVFEHFQELEQRKDQPAGTLSGGEQQMLALGRAFVAGPRLLMIDELSLGLAPVVVERLVGIVERFHERGTTLLLVEQSVNLALSLAGTVYFMERGEIRFKGPAGELLNRTDLLRSVFLEGATEAGLSGGDR